MAKMYLKSDLKFVDGYLIDNNDNVVALPDKVAEQINDLETCIQKLMYLDDQPEPTPERSLDGFERKSIRMVPTVKADTPTLDKKVAEGKQILSEIRELDKSEKINDVISDFEDAFEWFKVERFVEGSNVVRVDTLEIGNILNVDPEELIEEIASYLD